ncbi:MAG: transporter substrate-binding domain-containing protein [Oscillospiraceae bacterium]|nr:transporter substrate-binding domain-containing protein [Oscillospiraceae bacterium]
MNVIKRICAAFLAVLLFAGLFSGCVNYSSRVSEDEAVEFTSYRDIPGISRNTIKEAEELLASRNSFTFGMMQSTEAFLTSDNNIRGFSALMCEWLTEMFGVPFILEHFTWVDLREGLSNGNVDFTGTMTRTEERLSTYFMTDSIAQRSVRVFRIIDSPTIEEISKTRLPRYALLQGSVSAENILRYKADEFEHVFVAEYVDAYEMLKSGEVDALLAESSAEAIFDVYRDVITTAFMPFIYSPVSLTAQNPELEPIINIVQAALENNATRFLYELYDKGNQEYLAHKLRFRLTDEELDFIKNNPVIHFGAEYDNYPASFFDTRYREWQGITFDVLEKVSALTGLDFVVQNDENTEFYELLEKLTNGDFPFISELIRTPAREENFLWLDYPFMADSFILISKVTQRNIGMNNVYSVSVGVSKGTAHAEFFRTLYPNHQNLHMFDSQEAALQALMNDEIDMMMSNYSTLLYLTNYLELPDYKANIIFEESFESGFGFNKNEKHLQSIFNKALALVDVKIITEQWMQRRYDYLLSMTQAQIPWLIGVTVLSLCVILLAAMLLLRSRRVGKQLEELVASRTHELALQTATLSTLFDHIPSHIFAKDLDLTYTQANKAMLEHFGLSKNDVIGNDDITALGIPLELAEKFRAIDRRVMSENKIIVVEDIVPGVDGSNHMYEISKVPLVLHGAAIGVLGISYNINALKERERQTADIYNYANRLRDSLSEITKSPTISAGNINAAADVISKVGCIALNVSRLGIWSLSNDGTYLINSSYYNAADDTHARVGNFDLIDRKEYAGLLETERLIVMSSIAECAKIAYNVSEVYENDMCAALDAPIRIDGKLIGVVCVEQFSCSEYTTRREWIMEEQNFTSSLADIMALAISSADRHRAREAAELASQTKSTFLANMSHEIRTPMNAILGVTEILIQHESLPASIEEGLNKIYNSCDLLLGIINDILDFSKIEAGKLDIASSQYKVASLINDSVQLNMMRIDSKPIEFELVIDENLPAQLIGDSLRIKQILNNLLSNAFKYTEEGKVTLAVTAKGEFDSNITNLELKISDTGHGMTDDQQGKLFEEYSRFTDQGKSTVEGTGLGLAITQRLVNLMGGGISVDSKAGVGSTFTVLLPQQLVDNEKLGKRVVESLKRFRSNFLSHKQRYKINRDPMPYGSVLIVDDVETNLYVAVGLMRLYKLQIDTAMSGREAIDRIEAGNTYDIIFMDHMMPGMDGIETTEILRKTGYDKPIVALTANAVAGQADVFLQNGFDDFISKPIDIRQLNTILNTLVRDKQPEHVIEAARLSSNTNEADSSDSDANPAHSLLMESFIRDAERALETLTEIINDGSFNADSLQRFTTVVHGIKSSLRNIGAEQLGEVAYTLEICGREKTISLLKEQTPGFIDELHELLEQLKAEQATTVSSSKSDDLAEKLLSVKKMCAEYNRLGVLEVLAEIRNYSDEAKELAGKLEEHIHHGAFEEAEALAEASAAAAPQAVSAQQLASIKDMDINGLDIIQGLQKYNDDEKTYMKVLKSYALSVSTMLDTIEALNIGDTSSADDLKRYEITVHGIKGASYDIIASKVGDTALQLEDAAEFGNIELIKEAGPLFITATRDFVAKIKETLAALSTESSKPKKDKPDDELLTKLVEACNKYDLSGAEAIMAQIENYSYDADDGLAEWLRSKVDLMRFSDITAKLSENNN